FSQDFPVQRDRHGIPAFGRIRPRSFGDLPRNDDFGDRTDAAAAQRIVASAFDAGVNFIDTADVYAKGASETIVGAAISANRRRWILATKVGNVMTAKPHDGGLSRRWIVQACEDSL